MRSTPASRAWRRKNAPAIEDYNRRLEAGEFDEFLRRF
jgi:hypothetical protein